jgi:hypothetical protein
MTSLIAISEDTTVDPRDPRRCERLPVEVPAGVSAEGVGLMPAVAPMFYAEASPMVDMDRTAMTPSSRYSSASSLKASRKLSLGWQALGKVRFLHKERVKPFPGPIVIETARVLQVDDQILVLEFEVPVEGFVLPDEDAKIHVTFPDFGESPAGVLAHDSTRPGPHRAGLTVRLSLKLKGEQRWDHEAATIHWRGPLRAEQEAVEVDVEIRIALVESW